MRVCAAACGDSSRSATSKVSSGALASEALNCAFLKAASWSSGTSTTISGVPGSAIATTGRPSATTWPTSKRTAVTTPLREARSTVYFRRLRASSSWRACASAAACAVCAPLWARSSSATLTEPSVFSEPRRLRSDSAWRACATAAVPLLARGLLGEPVVGVVQHGQDVALVHELADVDLALRDLAAHAEGLVDLVAGLHRAGVAVGFAGGVVADFGGAHRPGRLGGGLVRAAGGEHRGDGQCDGRGEDVLQGSSSFGATGSGLRRGDAAVGGAGIGGGLEHLPAAAQRLVELHAVEQQPSAAVVGADAHRQARALRIEQRQQVDLPAVVERLRAAQRRFGGGGGGLQRLRPLPFDESATSAFSTSSSARTMPSSARSNASLLAALGDFVEGAACGRR